MKLFRKMSAVQKYEGKEKKKEEKEKKENIKKKKEKRKKNETQISYLIVKNN